MVEGREGGEKYPKWEERREFKKNVFTYFIQHCFVCRPSDFAASEDAVIEPRTVAISALAARCSKHLIRENLVSEMVWRTSLLDE